MGEDKTTFKTITFRLSEEELKKLKEFAETNGVSINNFLKKVIAMGFNLKTKNIANHSQFLSASVKPNLPTMADKVIMQAVLETWFMMRGKEGEEMLLKARDFAKNKTKELVGG